MTEVPLAIRAAQAFQELPAQADPGGQLRNALPQLITALEDRSLELPDRAGILALAWQLKLLLERAIALPKAELAQAMKDGDIRQLGPIVRTSRGIGVEWPVNDPANWGDAGVQDWLRALSRSPLHTMYIRHVPDHFEIDTLALGEGVRDGIAVAVDIRRTLDGQDLRTERERRPALVLREPGR